MPDEPITPPLILKQALELNKSISLLDVYRMDATNVAQRILQIIPTPTIEKMKSFNEPEINAAILTTLLQATSVLPLQQTEMVTNQLRILAGTDTEEQIKIDRVLLQKETGRLGATQNLVNPYCSATALSAYLLERKNMSF